MSKKVIQHSPLRILIPVFLLLSACTEADHRPAAELAASDTIRVLAYNIHHGEGMDELLDLGRIAELIRDVNPDLVSIQEVDSVADRTNQVDQAVELGRLTGMESRFGRFMSYQGGAYGMALLSRLPIVSSTNYRLPDGTEPRTALAAIVEMPDTGALLRFIGIHFYETEEQRLAQAQKLENYLDSDDKLPTILAGDFNSKPQTAVMDHLSESWQVVDKGEDHFTFPSYDPAREIDFFLLQPSGRFEILSQRVLDEPVISDHRPLMIELVIRQSN